LRVQMMVIRAAVTVMQNCSNAKSMPTTRGSLCMLRNYEYRTQIFVTDQASLRSSADILGIKRDMRKKSLGIIKMLF